jgi:hypothetical protein
MSLRDRKFFQVGVNMYVPGAQYGAAPIHQAPARFDLGIPATAAPAAVATGISAQGTLNVITYLALPITIDGTYGRSLTYTPSGVPGTNNLTDIIGYDYLGQPMFERITGAAAASALIAGLKAFKTVIGTRLILAASNAITFTIGTGLVLGIPYKGKIFAVKEGATELTFAQVNTASVAPVLTDPATGLTGEPRGMYTPLTAPNGVLQYEISMNGDGSVNAANNGGLYGIRHAAF